MARKYSPFPAMMMKARGVYGVFSRNTPLNSVFANGAWNDTATWNDVHIWKDVA